MEIEIFEDLETGKSWTLKPNEYNFLEKFLGFCPTCQNVYTERHYISHPNIKIFLGNRCKTYWDSINTKIPQAYRPLYCGHDESKGWIKLQEMSKSQ